jgi:hypothetical protein
MRLMRLNNVRLRVRMRVRVRIVRLGLQGITLTVHKLSSKILTLLPIHSIYNPSYKIVFPFRVSLRGALLCPLEGSILRNACFLRLGLRLGYG